MTSILRNILKKQDIFEQKYIQQLFDSCSGHDKFFKLLLTNQRAVKKYCGNGGVVLNLYKIGTLNLIWSRSRHSSDFQKEENELYQSQNTGGFEIEL